MIWRGSLFRKYAVLFVALVSGALFSSGLLEIYFSYQENKEALVTLQHEKALGAAASIEQFVKEVERQISWTTQPSIVAPAAAMRDRVAELAVGWKKAGFELDFGIGIAHGYATLGAIGFEGRLDYGAIGTVTNLAARLCSEAKPGQILLIQRVMTTVEALIEAEPVGDVSLKGLSRPVKVFNLVRLTASP